jgi:hypothetical protein
MIEPILHAVAADHVFDGAAVHKSATVIVDDARIVQVVPQVDVPRTIALQVLPKGAWLAPGFIDLQVNGGGDVLSRSCADKGLCKPGGSPASLACHRPHNSAVRMSASICEINAP